MRDWESWEGLSQRREISGEILSTCNCLMMGGNKGDEVIPFSVVPRERKRRNKQKVHFYLELWRLFFYFCAGNQTMDQIAQKKCWHCIFGVFKTLLDMALSNLPQVTLLWEKGMEKLVFIGANHSQVFCESKILGWKRYFRFPLLAVGLRCHPLMLTWANTLMSTSWGPDTLNLSSLLDFALVLQLWKKIHLCLYLTPNKL